MRYMVGLLEPLQGFNVAKILRTTSRGADDLASLVQKTIIMWGTELEQYITFLETRTQIVKL